MNIKLPGMSTKVLMWVVTAIVIVALVATSPQWMSAAGGLVDNTLLYFRGGSIENEDEQESDDGSSSIELSKQARQNIGLTDDMLGPVELTTYHRGITVPAIVVERPGRTQIKVATPMTGVITHVHAVTGQAVGSGTLLFQIRLTHEDLVKAQTEFLKTIGELDVERREVARLTDAVRTGAVAKINLLQRQYAQEKLESLLSAQKEALRLHGLSEQQVEKISVERRLLRELQIVAPFPDQHREDELRLTIRNISFDRDEKQDEARNEPQNDPHGETHSEVHTGDDPLVLSELNVHKGQAVEAGTTLCVVSDMRKLFIEGRAFEQDTATIEQSAAQGWPISAITHIHNDKTETIEDLSLVYVDNQVSDESRVIKFYVDLPNTILRRSAPDEHQRFIAWKYKPGQRMQLRVRAEEWPRRIVLPVEAVAGDGAEFFVFMQNGSRFDRRPVHVEYRDQFSVVIANDGSLFPGDIVAMTGAHLMQMALKKRSAPAVPHGHSH